MPKEGDSSGGIQISNSTITILLFLFVQSFGAVWWASGQTAETRNINVNMAASAAAAKQQRSEDQAAMDRELQSLKKTIAEQADEIKVLQTYNQRTREELAARHIIIR